MDSAKRAASGGVVQKSVWGAWGTKLARVDQGLGQVEASMATAMLLLMLVVAFAQAFLRNLTQSGALWANEALAWLDWGDFVLQKGTLWLAFLGASLAVHSDKHVAIDIVPRLVGSRVRLLLRGLVGLSAAFICAWLASAFYDAIAVNGAERAAEFELMASGTSVHVCDASPEILAEAHAHRGLFCVVRSALGLVGVRMETPGAAFQLIVPVMLAVMTLRAFFAGLTAMLRFANGESDDGSAHGLPSASTEVADDIAHHGGRAP